MIESGTTKKLLSSYHLVDTLFFVTVSVADLYVLILFCRDVN